MSKYCNNDVIIAGILCFDPLPLRASKNGTKYTRIRLVNRYVDNEHKNRVFVDCWLWDKNAVFVCKYLKKKDWIKCFGWLKSTNYVTKQGYKVENVITISVNKIKVRRDYFEKYLATIKEKPNDSIKEDLQIIKEGDY